MMKIIDNGISLLLHATTITINKEIFHFYQEPLLAQRRAEYKFLCYNAHAELT